MALVATYDCNLRQVVSLIPGENEIFNIFIFFALVSKQSTALSSATQHALLPKFSGKCVAERPTNRPILLNAGYSVKLKKHIGIKKKLGASSN